MRAAINKMIYGTPDISLQASGSTKINLPSERVKALSINKYGRHLRYIKIQNGQPTEKMSVFAERSISNDTCNLIVTNPESMSGSLDVGHSGSSDGHLVALLFRVGPVGVREVNVALCRLHHLNYTS